MNDYLFLALQIARVASFCFVVWFLTYAFFLITP
jgi:hypothetical protein